MPELPVVPTALARQWTRSVVGFTVGVAIGLAPYLGAMGVPLFSPLLGLLPRELRGSLIPISAALMGLVAVSVQWYGSERANKASLRKLFLRCLFASVTSIVCLFLLRSFLVADVKLDGGQESEAVVSAVT